MKSRKNESSAEAAEYNDLRAALIKRGFTIRSFALTHGYSVPTTYCAARGKRTGVKSHQIAAHLKTLAYAPKK